MVSKKKQLRDKFDRAFALMTKFHIWAGFTVGAFAATSMTLLTLGAGWQITLAGLGGAITLFYLYKTNKVTGG